MLAKVAHGGREDSDGNWLRIRRSSLLVVKIVRRAKRVEALGRWMADSTSRDLLPLGHSPRADLLGGFVPKDVEDESAGIALALFLQVCRKSTPPQSSCTRQLMAGADGGYPSGNSEYKGLGGLVACVFYLLFVSHRVLEKAADVDHGLGIFFLRISAALDIVFRSSWICGAPARARQRE